MLARNMQYVLISKIQSYLIISLITYALIYFNFMVIYAIQGMYELNQLGVTNTFIRSIYGGDVSAVSGYPSENLTSSLNFVIYSSYLHVS